jgi:hypothetical protein
VWAFAHSSVLPRNAKTHDKSDAKRPWHSCCMPSDLYADCICIANKLLTIPFGIIAGVFCGADAENPEPFAPGVPELIAQLQASRTGAEGRGDVLSG